MSIGVFNQVRQAAAFAKTNNTLANTELILPIAAGQSFSGDAFLPFTLAGAASGAAVQVTVPAAGTSYILGYNITNGSSATVVQSDVITASAAFSNALANAADHYISLQISIVNGANAGNITIQFAQLVTDAAAATLLAGAWFKGWFL